MGRVVEALQPLLQPALPRQDFKWPHMKGEVRVAFPKYGTAVGELGIINGDELQIQRFGCANQDFLMLRRRTIKAEIQRDLVPARTVGDPSAYRIDAAIVAKRGALNAHNRRLAEKHVVIAHVIAKHQRALLVIEVRPRSTWLCQPVPCSRVDQRGHAAGHRKPARIDIAQVVRGPKHQCPCLRMQQIGPQDRGKRNLLDSE